MGFRNRNYDKSPYRIYSERWIKFNDELESVRMYVEKVTYDGFTKNSYKTKTELENLMVAQFALEDFEEVTNSKIFTLPQNYEIGSKYLSEPEQPPEFPNLPIPPHSESEYGDTEFIGKKLLELDKLDQQLNNKKDEFKKIYQDLLESIHDIHLGISLLNPKKISNEKLILRANKSHYLPEFLRKNFLCNINVESRIAIIQFEFPDFTNVDIISGYKKIKYTRVPKFFSEIQKKKLVKTCLYSLIIRNAVLASKFNACNFYDSVIVNVEQNWFDPATGQPRNGIIATLQAPNDYLNSLDLSKLDPEICFKNLKGISTPNLQNISPVRPIFILNKEDERFVENKVVQIEDEANLAAMPWEDFEHLVAQLFEWEFAKNGIEVKVTRASRDRGVDAILFDPDPLRGGKYVLQAKRYTRTVDVSAVRDLYGTIMNEGANRGIIITTASFGPDAYEFSKDKPISLVDGQNLLLMLQKHGKKFKIDLEEARQMNIENQR